MSGCGRFVFLCCVQSCDIIRKFDAYDDYSDDDDAADDDSDDDAAADDDSEDDDAADDDSDDDDADDDSDDGDCVVNDDDMYIDANDESGNREHWYTHMLSSYVDLPQLHKVLRDYLIS